MIPGLSFEIHFCLTERVTDFGQRGWERKEFIAFICELYMKPCKRRAGPCQRAKILFTLTALTSLGNGSFRLLISDLLKMPKRLQEERLNVLKILLKHSYL